jgi:hypothetical protein
MCISHQILVFVVLISAEQMISGIPKSDEGQKTDCDELRQSEAASAEISEKGGRVLSKGEGDHLLRQDSNLVPPLRTTDSVPRLREVGGALHGFEAVKANVDVLVAHRHESAMGLSETIPGSKFKKFYIVQFETRPDGYLGPDGRFRSDGPPRPDRRPLSDGHPGPEWRPLFVIAWKATNPASTSFVYQWPVAQIEIERHLVRPPSATIAIYALKPDYSLEMISLTKEETARLLSHVTDMEKRQDQRLSHLVSFIEQKDPRWKESLSAVRANEGLFSSDPYWRQKVDPHLKVVEPAKGVLDPPNTTTKKKTPQNRSPSNASVLPPSPASPSK